MIGTFCTADTKALAKRERDPICDVCGHNHVQGVKCDICGHVGKYIGATQPAGAPVTTGLAVVSHGRLLVPGMPAVPGGPNRPNRGAIPPVPPGPLHAPNLTPPTIEGLSVQNFQQALQTFFELIAHPQVTAQLPVELRNLDQLKVLLDTLPDYHSEDEPLMCLPYHAALS